MKEYRGIREADGTAYVEIVEVSEEDPDEGVWVGELTHVVRHSPTGLEWGYGGSGPADTARSLLADLFPVRLANLLYQDFKWDYVAEFPSEMPRGLPRDRRYEQWRVSEAQIREWVRLHTRSCSECSGTGRVAGDGIDEETFVCFTCRGSGWVRADLVTVHIVGDTHGAFDTGEVQQ